MKPNFALSLSFEGISLLHRGKNGWFPVGDVPLDAADLGAELAHLRQTAKGLEKRGLATKIVLPDDQVRYISLETGEGDDEARHAAALAAMDGATPYALEELSVCWSPDGPVTHVAAVARETLAEAEAFAEDHRFNPVCFVAIPPDGAYAGEPFFGLTRSAAEDPALARTIGPDPVAIRITQRREAATAKPPEEEAPPAEAAVPAPADVEVEATPEPTEPVPAFSSIRAGRDPRGARADGDLSPGGSGDAGEDAPSVPRPPRRLTLADSEEEIARIGAMFRDKKPEPPAATKEKATARVSGAVAALRNGKPQDRRTLGLVLTVLLLLCLAAIAAWATVFNNDGLAGIFGKRMAPDAVASAPDIVQPARLPDPAQGRPNEPTPPDEIDDSAEVEGDSDGLAAPQQRPPPISPREAEARYAATGIWQRAPNPPPAGEPESLDGLTLPEPEGQVPGLDAVALPQADAALTDAIPRRFSSPAPPGTRFAFDERGLVQATPDGAMTPEGIRVFAGAPPARPPAFPERAAETPLEDAVLGPSRLRPRPRPEGIAARYERIRNGGFLRSELAGLRPKARPANAKVKLEEDQTPTERAIAASLKPHARPAGFARIVARTRESEANSENVQLASAAAVRSVAPRIPTTASVARQATLRNAINLKKVNLIGVYGKPSDRRALVRLASGRYQKVKVGDRIDGGKVAAIGDSELRYVKSGRNVVLKLPRG